MTIFAQTCCPTCAAISKAPSGCPDAWHDTPAMPPAAPVAPAPMESFRTPLSEKAKETMTDFEREYPWGGNDTRTVHEPRDEAEREYGAHMYQVGRQHVREEAPVATAPTPHEVISAALEQGIAPTFRKDYPVASAETAQRGESREEFERDRFGTAGPFTPLPKFPQLVGTASSGAIREQSWRAEATEAKPPQPTGTPEPLREAQPGTFREWWFNVGYEHMPKGDQPPEHAAIAELAWNAALAAVPQASPPDYAAFVALAEKWKERTHSLAKRLSAGLHSAAPWEVGKCADELKALIAQQRGGK